MRRRKFFLSALVLDYGISLLHHKLVFHKLRNDVDSFIHFSNFLMGCPKMCFISYCLDRESNSLI